MVQFNRKNQIRILHSNNKTRKRVVTNMNYVLKFIKI